MATSNDTGAPAPPPSKLTDQELEFRSLFLSLSSDNQQLISALLGALTKKNLEVDS